MDSLLLAIVAFIVALVPLCNAFGLFNDLTACPVTARGIKSFIKWLALLRPWRGKVDEGGL